VIFNPNPELANME